jgi:hypothetical protein
MNSQSWVMAPSPANSAGPIERARFTDVLSTGMLTRWIRVSARPMAIGANPRGARAEASPSVTAGLACPPEMCPTA